MSTITDDEHLAAALWANVPQIGPIRLQRVLSWGKTYLYAWQHAKYALTVCGLSTRELSTAQCWIDNHDLLSFNKILIHEKLRVILPADPDFPILLSQIPAPPSILFVRGQIHENIRVALVGTRLMTSYGERVVKHLIPELVNAGCSVVSGLALGIDGHVHRMTLASGGHTIAVLGSGADQICLYPRAHVSLANEIVKAGGAILSEFPPGTATNKGFFPLRNRLIAGLCQATVVVEAAKKSGSLITAQCALAANREVLAVPGSLWNIYSEGTHHLLRLGAHVCTSAQDILDAIAIDRPDLIASVQKDLPLTAAERTCLQALPAPTHIDDLCPLVGQSIHALSSLLSILELRGLVHHLGGQVWAKSAH